MTKTAVAAGEELPPQQAKAAGPMVVHVVRRGDRQFFSYNHPPNLACFTQDRLFSPKSLHGLAPGKYIVAVFRNGKPRDTALLALPDDQGVFSIDETRCSKLEGLQQLLPTRQGLGCSGFEPLDFHDCDRIEITLAESVGSYHPPFPDHH